MGAMVTVRLRYWAGARAAAGTGEEDLEAASVAGALDAARAVRGPRFAAVVAASTVLIDGVAADEAALQQVRESAVLAEILPPFAGGSGVCYSTIHPASRLVS